MNKLLKTIVRAIEDKKGENIVSIDMTHYDGAVCEHFVICNADSTTQVMSIAGGVEEATRRELDIKVWRVNGQENSTWIAMDYGSIIVHIFQTEMRDFYNIEELWNEAPITQY